MKITLDFFPNAKATTGQNKEPSIINESHLNNRSRQVINRYYETKDPYFSGELVLAQKTRARKILKLEQGIVETVQELLGVDVVIATQLLIGLDYLGCVKFYNGGGGMCFRTLKELA